MSTMTRRVAACAGAVLAMSGLAAADLNLGGIPGLARNLGSDGAFTPVANTTLDLSLAADGVWTDAGSGNGVYDNDQWAVVYKFSEVNIPSGVTVNFANHPSGAPVIWVVSGDVTIGGTVTLNGGGGICPNNPPVNATPGPGGFRGGLPSESAVVGMAGLGPGGGNIGDSDSGGGGGGYAGGGGGGNCGGGAGGTTYGNEFIIPLIGGSGGGGGRGGNATGAGAGAGAILIVAAGDFVNTGLIRANGGNSCNVNDGREGGGGSGGGIRIVADTISGNGFFQALGGSGGDGDSFSCRGGNGGVGRIRIEANSVDLATSGEPPYSLGVPADPPIITPPDTAPLVRVLSVGGAAAPDNPGGDLSFPNADIEFDSDTAAPVVVEGINVPLDSTVRVRITPRNGTAYTVDAVNIGGNAKLSTWQADVDFANGFGAIQVRAILPAEGG